MSPISRGWANSFSSSSFPGLTRDPDLCVETSSLYWLCITRFTSVASAVCAPSFEVASCPRFGMAQSQIALGLEKENFGSGYNHPSRNSWCWTVLDTCLIVGLRPSVIILITTSLSSKCTAETLLEKNVCWFVCDPLHLGLGFGITNCASLLVSSMVGLNIVYISNTSITMSQRTRANSPSIGNSASRQMTSDSVELC